MFWERMVLIGKSHDMPLNKLSRIIFVMIGSDLIYPPAKISIVYLPETKFNEKGDRACARCANIGLIFSSKFRDCFDMNLEAAFFDSSTIK